MEDSLGTALDKLRTYSEKKHVDITEELKRISEKLVEKDDTEETWDIVQKARAIERPGTLEYIQLICDDFMELHGDRCYGDDPALVGGVGSIDGRPITFIGNQKGSSMKENVRRSFGQGKPEGYRKALRLAQQAEKFSRPIVTFVDTQGAFPGIESEERGIGEAIACNLKRFSVLRTPIICFFVGEGGSGGALGIGVGDKLYMLENAVYSVISPEGFSSILMGGPQQAKEAAAKMKMTAENIVRMGIAHGVLLEPPGGAQADPGLMASRIKKVLLSDLEVLCSKSTSELIRYRTRKIRRMGHFEDDQRGGDLFQVFTKIFSN